jgi:hypothetical protein
MIITQMSSVVKKNNTILCRGIFMKTGRLVKDRKNKAIFVYEDECYSYDTLYTLVRTMEYHKSGEDCDWNIIRVHDIKDDKDCYCVVFQESTTSEDWIHNFDFLPRPVKAYKGWKHRLVYHDGFYREYQSARDEIKSYLSPLLQDLATEQKCEIKELKLYVIGFSLGGSIAPIAMEDFYETYNMKPILIAFEGANPCESIHTRNYLMKCLNTEESIAFVYSNDFVPRCVPIFGKKLKKIIYYLNDHKCKFPFYFIKKIISFIKDTAHYHLTVDEGIRNYMPIDSTSKISE